MKTLLVSEIFASIQGESHYSGYPCAFVRLTGCNLDCSYCDTRYAKSGGTEMSIEEIAERVAMEGMPTTEVTGGEPLAQPLTPELLARLCRSGTRVLLETNGSLPLDKVPSEVYVVMDVKAPGSGEHLANRWENLPRVAANGELKVVVCTREDYDWAVAELSARGVFGPIKVTFSPVAGGVAATDLAKWMVEDRLNARFQLQLHKLLWPATERGV